MIVLNWLAAKTWFYGQYGFFFRMCITRKKKRDRGRKNIFFAYALKPKKLTIKTIKPYPTFYPANFIRYCFLWFFRIG